MAIIYHVNEEERTVKAELVDTSMDAINIFNKMQKRFEPKYKVIELRMKHDRYVMRSRYYGKAVCSEHDTWNVEVGKSIAKQRCINNYKYALHTKLNMMAEDLFNMYCDFNDFMEKAGRWDFGDGTDILNRIKDDKGDFIGVEKIH